MGVTEYWLATTERHQVDREQGFVPGQSWPNDPSRWEGAGVAHAFLPGEPATLCGHRLRALHIIEGRRFGSGGHFTACPECAALAG